MSGSIWPTSFKFLANLWSRSGKQGRTSNFFIWQSEPWCSQRIRKQKQSNISYRKCAFNFTKKPLEATVTNCLVTELGFLACRKSCRFVGLLIICHGVSWRFELKYVWHGKNRSGHTLEIEEGGVGRHGFFSKIKSTCHGNWPVLACTWSHQVQMNWPKYQVQSNCPKYKVLFAQLHVLGTWG